MMDRQFGKIVIECDNCGDPLDTEEHDFANALEKLRAEGWRSEKDKGGAWCHFCPECPSQRSVIR